METTAVNGIYKRASDWFGLLDALYVVAADAYEIKIISDILKPGNCRTVLDCACGTGILAAGLAKQGFEVTAVDTDEEALAKAKQRAGEQGACVRFESGDVRNLHKQFHDSDAVICWHSEIARFQEGTSLRLALRSIYNCLRDGGIAIFETLGFEEIMDTEYHFPIYRVRITGLDMGDKRGSIIEVGSCPSMETPYLVTFIYILDAGGLDNATDSHAQVEFAPLCIDVFQNYLEYAGFKEIEVQDDDSRVLYICRK